jgi:DNA invertase Pin-like site-specific DNA recombinase
MAASAQAQAEATKIAQRAGIDHRKVAEDGGYRGRKPSFTRAQFTEVGEWHAMGLGVSEIAKETGLTRGTVYRLIEDPAKAAAILTSWGL